MLVGGGGLLGRGATGLGVAGAAARRPIARLRLPGRRILGGDGQLHRVIERQPIGQPGVVRRLLVYR